MRPAFFHPSNIIFEKYPYLCIRNFKIQRKMKKAIFSLLLMAASVIGSSAQGNATAQNPQDVDVLYAKNLLAIGTEAPAFPALKREHGRYWTSGLHGVLTAAERFLPSRRCIRSTALVLSLSAYQWIPTSRSSTTTLRQTVWNGSSTASSRSGKKPRFPRITRFHGSLPCISSTQRAR